MTTAKPSEAWDTAVGVARVRARETRRENPLFLDPLAEAFAAAGSLPVDGEPPRAPVDDAARRRWGAVAFSIVVRTRFLDELLRDAADAGCRQVVLLGAGMASRAYRLDWPSGTRLFEIDTAEPLGFTESVLRAEPADPRCERITVPVDLRDDWTGAPGRCRARSGAPHGVDRRGPPDPPAAGCGRTPARAGGGAVRDRQPGGPDAGSTRCRRALRAGHRHRGVDAGLRDAA